MRFTVRTLELGLRNLIGLPGTWRRGHILPQKLFGGLKLQAGSEEGVLADGQGSCCRECLACTPSIYLAKEGTIMMAVEMGIR